MAIVTWIGAASSHPQLDTLTVGSTTSGHTFITTINGKAITYTAGTGETVTTIAAAILALLQASNEGEFTELTFAAGVTAGTLTVTGPADGAPFTLSVSGGTGTYSRTGTTAPISPHDAATVTNYSGGALPSNGDHLVLERTNVSILYGLTALAGISLASFTRKRSFTGQVGLPDTADGGYREYRTRELSVNAPIITVEQTGSDRAQQVRILAVDADPVTMVVAGDGVASPLGSEAIEVRGLPADSTLTVIGASVAVATAAGTVATIDALTAHASTVRLGSGVTLDAATVRNATAQLDCTATTLNVDGGTTIVGEAAATTNLAIDAGSVLWRSTGSPGTVVVGGGGQVDFSQAPAAVAVTAVTLNAGSGWFDPLGRVTADYDLVLNRCTVAEVGLDVGVGKTLTVN